MSASKRETGVVYTLSGPGQPAAGSTVSPMTGVERRNRGNC
ncbi:hypothetical protein PV703_13880 [Streptomyces sp. ME01-24h]|nr:hypothetical protein [Streptomyces sp. ME01-24h]